MHKRPSHSLNTSVLSQYHQQLPAIETSMLRKRPIRDNSVLLTTRQFVTKDPESLKEEMMNLKRANNQLREQNKLLTARLRMSHNDDLQQQLDIKDQQIAELKRNNRASRVHELEMELQNSKHEIQRMHQIISKLEVTTDQNKVIQLLSTQLIEEENKNAELQQKINTLSKKVSQNRWEINQLIQKNAILKQQVQEGNVEISELKKAIEVRKTQRKDQLEIITETVKVQQRKIDEQNAELQMLKEQLAIQQKQFKARWEMEEKLQQQYSHQRNKRETGAYEQEILARSLEERPVVKERENSIYINESAQASYTLQMIQSQPQIVKTPTQNQQQTQINNLKETIQKTESQPDLNEKQYTPKSIENDAEKFDKIKQFKTEPNKQSITIRLPKVNGYDVEDLGVQLRLRFMSKRVEQNDIDDLLTPNESITIRELIQNLEGEPFSVTDLKQRQLLARYLVEDNTDEQITYDDALESDKNIVKSVFKKLVGRYTLFTDRETSQIKRDLYTVFTKYKNSFIDTIQMLTMKKKHLQKDFCEQDDLQEAIKFCDMNFTPRQREFINLLIYDQSENIQVFNYKILVNRLLEQVLDAGSQSESEQKKTINSEAPEPQPQKSPQQLIQVADPVPQIQDKEKAQSVDKSVKDQNEEEQEYKDDFHEN